MPATSIALTWNMNENMWNADGTWNIIRNATQTTCHGPMWPISSDIQSPVSSKLWLSRSFCLGVGGTFISITLALLNRLSGVALALKSPAPFCGLHRWSLRFTTLCQRSGLMGGLLGSSSTSIFGACNVSAIVSATNKTFCRRVSPVVTGSEAIFTSARTHFFRIAQRNKKMCWLRTKCPGDAAEKTLCDRKSLPSNTNPRSEFTACIFIVCDKFFCTGGAESCVRKIIDTCIDLLSYSTPIRRLSHANSPFERVNCHNSHRSPRYLMYFSMRMCCNTPRTTTTNNSEFQITAENIHKINDTASHSAAPRSTLGFRKPAKCWRKRSKAIAATTTIVVSGGLFKRSGLSINWTVF